MKKIRQRTIFGIQGIAQSVIGIGGHTGEYIGRRKEDKKTKGEYGVSLGFQARDQAHERDDGRQVGIAVASGRPKATVRDLLSALGCLR